MAISLRRPPRERLLPINALADQAGISRATAWRIVSRAGLTHHRVSGQRESCIDVLDLVADLVARQLGKRPAPEPQPSAPPWQCPQCGHAAYEELSHERRRCHHCRQTFIRRTA
ncbi:hypothetical protein [Candidatus Nephthysia bennettiae]|uniref:Uncharacterized protein n=1 Tax=Candidatus Nephthysia bennettiae TaxID=3127016 RepID=A0A934K2L5_9BACT|nr:hypothetical protein [Candidatus Dormibacteraeota bacterium]MBJ7611919.1 hypothetical protein [Candidatus Dormibacteraeota bacterium]